MSQQSHSLPVSTQVCVVVLNWNGWRDTCECLDSIICSSSRDLDVHIVLLDNGSSDGSAEVIRQYLEARQSPPPTTSLSSPDDTSSTVRRAIPESCRVSLHFLGDFLVTFIEAQNNLGFCAGNNLGMAIGFSAGADYCLLLNNDAVLSSQALVELAGAAQTNPDAGLLTPVIVYADDPATVWHAGGRFTWFLETHRDLYGSPVSKVTSSTPFPTSRVSGCAMFVTRAAYSSVGEFDEAFFIWAEDWDLSIRARCAGWSLLVVPAATVLHKVGRTLGIMAPLSYYYGTRNRLLLKRKHLPVARRALYFPFFLATRFPRYLHLLAIGKADTARCGIEAILDYGRGRTGKWSKHDEWAQRQARRKVA